MKKHFKLISIFLCLTLVVLLVGCSAGSKANLIKDANLAESRYNLGDYMGDYTVTDVNGNTYTFSELLDFQYQHDYGWFLK